MKLPSKKEIDEMDREQLESISEELEKQSNLSSAASIAIKKNKISDEDKEQVKKLFESKSTNDRISALKELAGLYEDKKLRLDIQSLNRKYSIEIGFIVIIPLLATILSSVFINLASALAPLAIGAANAIDKLTVSKSLIATYGKDKEAIQSRPAFLRVRIRLAEAEHDPAKQKSILDYVQGKIEEYFPEVQVSQS
jgi:hypothetical protein